MSTVGPMRGGRQAVALTSTRALFVDVNKLER